MATTSFTARIDKDLKQALELIAKYEDRSASYMAGQAIRAFVKERLATRALLETGLELVENDTFGISSGEIHKWLLSKKDKPFPDTD